MGEKKEKKITFSEEIDSSINGFALGISFVFLAIFVMYFEIFHNTIIERVIAIILLILGIAGTLTELGKIKKDDIKGIDNLLIGLFFTVIPITAILKMDMLLLNVLAFLVLLLGAYGTTRGIFEIAYSLNIQRRKSGNVKIEIMKIVVAITEVIALIVAIIQLVTEVL